MSKKITLFFAAIIIMCAIISCDLIEYNGEESSLEIDLTESDLISVNIKSSDDTLTSNLSSSCDTQSDDVQASDFPEYTGRLHKGKKSDLVKFIQLKLFDLGYLESEPTGYYGDATVEAVKRLQEENGLDPNGEIDEDTYNLIKSFG